jgi:hypothetical protein
VLRARGSLERTVWIVFSKFAALSNRGLRRTYSLKFQPWFVRRLEIAVHTSPHTNKLGQRELFAVLHHEGSWPLSFGVSA